MSAILVIAGDALPSRDVAERMLRRMSARGEARYLVQAVPGALLGVARHEWETSPEFSGGVLVGQRGHLYAVADASIYYRAALRDALRQAGVTPHGDSATDLVLAAFEAWGAAAAGRLEGDFAFAVWNAAERRLVAARDFSGKRPLYMSRLRSGIVVASGMDAILAHPDVRAELDLPSIAALVGGLWVNAPVTAWRGLEVVPGAQVLEYGAGRTTVSPSWQLPEIESARERDTDAAAEQLRALLGAAIVERMPAGDATVWMSGGYDSTAVFGIARAALAERHDPRLVHPVSISYPKGDPGREDELIAQVASRWSADVRWLDIAGISMFEQPERGASTRDDILAHMYEHWNRALARTTRAAGSHVAFDGNGGDQLHQVSPVYFADLLRRGRWPTLWRDATVRGLATWHGLLRWAILPALPEPVHGLMTALRGGRPVRRHLERRLPPWINAEFVQRHALLEQEAETSPVPRTGSRSSRETAFYLRAAALQRAFGCIGGIALEEGVELRSPLYDRRVVEFVATRPREERASGPETKILLRRSARGAVPDTVLAPRRYRTGMTIGFSDRSMRAPEAAAMMRRAFDAPLLAELGVIDGAALRSALESYLATGRTGLRGELFMAFQAELWLRARLRSAASTDTARVEARREVTRALA